MAALVGRVVGRGARVVPSFSSSSMVLSSTSSWGRRCSGYSSDKQTHFGFQSVGETEKRDKVIDNH